MTNQITKPKGRRMFWLWILLAVIVGIPLVVVVVGFLLPERYEGVVTMTLDRPAEDVWAALADFRKHPHAGSMCKGVEPLPDVDGRPSWVEDMGSSRVTVTTTVADRPTRLVRHLADSVVRMTADGEFVIEPTATGCRVTARNVMMIRRGTWHTPIFRVIVTASDAAKGSVKDLLTRVGKTIGATTTVE